MESNDSPEIPDRGETSDTSGLPLGVPKEGITIGTWNVHSLHACTKVQELIHDFKCYRWDVLGLAEVRWTGFGDTTMDKGQKITHNTTTG